MSSLRDSQETQRKRCTGRTSHIAQAANALMEAWNVVKAYASRLLRSICPTLPTITLEAYVVSAQAVSGW